MTGDADPITEIGWRFLNDTAYTVLLVLDHAGTVKFANQYAKKLTGLTLEGDHLSAMLLIGSSNNSDNNSLLEQWQDSSSPHLMNIRTCGDLPQTLHVTVYPIKEGYLLFGQKDEAELDRLNRNVLALNHDLTNISRELNQKNAELSQLNLLKNQFLGMATHDLRNPVGGILLYTDLLIDGSPDSMSSEQLQSIRNIRSAALRMSRVINDFLDVSIIESGHLTLDIQKVNLADLIKSVQANVSVPAMKNQIRIDTALDPETLTLRVDGPKIEQVFINLLSNAIEYSSTGGCVTIRSQRIAEGVRFQIEDQGKGIPHEKQKRLFASFDGSGTQKKDGERSIGLGLVISRKIVEAHGGKMFVESEPGKGSVFGFVLPDSYLHSRQSGQTAGVPEKTG
ncbi:MAG: HAMP domain-containing sensor histidine kinase [Methanoregula sp.]|nr:HAMP domain-containing sensor histidine kinase [Methanoregula sp.]